MGSHRETDNGQTKKIDETAGGLVWVRRRNGSWWPGRILGLDELPKSCSVSPRPGTPVKLLGREDGSMLVLRPPYELFSRKKGPVQRFRSELLIIWLPFVNS